jgi:hypothetical protein
MGLFEHRGPQKFIVYMCQYVVFQISGGIDSCYK